VPRSMTGYGRGESVSDGMKIVVEAKSVNHRYSEVVTRLPRQLLSLEDRVRKAVHERVARGRIDLQVTLDVAAAQMRTVTVDVPLARKYYDSLNGLRDTLSIADPIALRDITALPDVIKVEESGIDIEGAWLTLSKAIDLCLNALLEMRKREGKELAIDTRARCHGIRQLFLEIEKRAPEVVKEYREKVARRVAEVLPTGAIDEPRVALEVFLMAERASITEELVRAKSHLDQLDHTLESDDIVGRKLDFLLQELNREVNTVASKSSDLSIAGAVVTIKSELEKIREQIQNLE
jgi:uncharacterized protein (TIGR00255 family)